MDLLIRTAAGMTTPPGLATRCSLHTDYRRGRRGTSSTPTTRSSGRLNLITHLLSQIPYEAPEQRKITLPARNEKPEGYVELDLTPYEVPTPF